MINMYQNKEGVKSFDNKNVALGKVFVNRYIKERIELRHHGIKGQKWGVRKGPPYPIGKGESGGKTVAKSSKHDTIVEDAIRSGKVLKKINKDKQSRHTKSGHLPGRSYLDGDLEYAQALVDKFSGTGEVKPDRNGNWNHKERITSPHIIGTYVDESGTEVKTNVGMIVYSKTGTHIYPARRREEKDET